MIFSIIAYTLSFIVTSAGTTDISLSDHSYISSEALFVIYKDSSLSDSSSILFIHFELVLVLLIVYTICVLFIVQQ